MTITVQPNFLSSILLGKGPTALIQLIAQAAAAELGIPADLPVKISLNLLAPAEDLSARDVPTGKFIAGQTGPQDSEKEAILQGKPPVNFTIYISPTLGVAKLLTVVCHEMIHVSQWTSRAFQLHQSTGAEPKVICQFRGLPTDNISYSDAPWEREAYAGEDGLASKVFDRLQMPQEFKLGAFTDESRDRVTDWMHQAFTNLQSTNHQPGEPLQQAARSKD